MTGTAPEASGLADTPRGPAISRRRLLGTGIAASLLVAGGATAATASTAPASPQKAAPSSPQKAAPTAPEVATPARRGYDFLDAAMDAYPDKGAIRLAQSYTDQAGLFSAAFTYDNALAILAYLADGRAASRARAIALGEALVYAQEHDPDHQDGRLRQGYNVGPYVFYDGVPQPDGFVRADGKANMCYQFGFTGTAVGDMAWAAIALVALARRTNRGQFRRAAIRIADWIEANARTDEPLGGYKFGVDGGNKRLPFTATEHNIDLVALFGQLAALTGKKVYRDRQAIARAFVKKMWQPDGGFFYTGTNDGHTVNTAQIPEDTQSWGYLALGGRRYAAALDWEAAKLAVSDHSGRVEQHGPGGPVLRGSHILLGQPAGERGRADRRVPAQARPQRRLVRRHGPPRTRLPPARRERRRAQGPRPDGLAHARPGPARSRADLRRQGRRAPLRGGVGQQPARHRIRIRLLPRTSTSGPTAWYLMAARRANPLAT